MFRDKTWHSSLTRDVNASLLSFSLTGDDRMGNYNVNIFYLLAFECGFSVLFPNRTLIYWLSISIKNVRFISVNRKVLMAT